MIVVENLQPGQIIRPTRNVTNTYPRRIERNEKNRFEFRRLRSDGSPGEIMWSGVGSMKEWVRKYKAVVDGRRAVPPFDAGHKGVQFFAKLSDGQWHYVNHANTWVTCPPPLA